MHETSVPKSELPGIEASRFKSFSDAIFAIILTIMIFSLKPPAAEGMRWLTSSLPTIIAYALSYLFVAVCWLNHHYNLRNIERVTAPLIWSNFLFLFWMSLLPFTTSNLADRQFSPFSVCIYALSFLPIVGAYMLFECCIALGRFGDCGHRAWLWIAMLRGGLTLTLFGLAAALAFLSAKAAFALVCTSPLLWVFPERLTRLGLMVQGRRDKSTSEQGRDGLQPDRHSLSVGEKL